MLFIVVNFVVTACHRDLKDPRDRFYTIGIKESIHSKILDEERPFFVYVPPYNKESPTKFPVLYLFDGEAHFHSVSGLVQILGTGVNQTRIVPEFIVVAIPNPNIEERRKYLSPGKGDDLLKFIQTELVPYIDKSYPTNSSRTLVGHSLGGLMTIQALYTMPETFDAYIAIDPSLWWDNRVLMKPADSIFSTKKFHSKFLYIAQANTLDPGTTTNEHYGAIKDFVKVLESSNNTSGINWSYKYYPDDSHSSVPLIAEYDGLRFINRAINTH